MGYFANGFVFTTEPDFSAASAAAPCRFARGYKHNQYPVWLLDFWKPRGKLLLRKAPFCDPAIDGVRLDTGNLDASTLAFLGTLQAFQNAMGHGPAELAYVHMALSVAVAARCPAFFFAADDEELDLGGRAVPGGLVSFSCRRDRLCLRYSDGQTTVTPLDSQDDEVGFQEVIARAKSVEGMRLLEPLVVEGGQALFENPVAQWPKDAGDPAEILGLGTWDPLLNLDDDFAVVFEHLSP